MAKKRMFSTEIIESDAFLTMPQSTQNLYFHLNMHADDDGFINNPLSIMNLIKANNDDMNLLMLKKFVISFEDKGLIVIKHWRIHNYLRSDRYKETNYQEEKQMLSLDDKGIYHTNNEISQIEIKPKNKKEKHKYGEYQHVLLTDDEVEKLNKDYPFRFDEIVKELDEYIEMKGYKANNHYLAIKKWVIKAIDERKEKESRIQFNNRSAEPDELPIYDTSKNQKLDEDRLNEILARRKNND